MGHVARLLAIEQWSCFRTSYILSSSSRDTGRNFVDLYVSRKLTGKIS